MQKYRIIHVIHVCCRI